MRTDPRYNDRISVEIQDEVGDDWTDITGDLREAEVGFTIVESRDSFIGKEMALALSYKIDDPPEDILDRRHRVVAIEDEKGGADRKREMVTRGKITSQKEPINVGETPIYDITLVADFDEQVYI